MVSTSYDSCGVVVLTCAAALSRVPVLTLAWAGPAPAAPSQQPGTRPWQHLRNYSLHLHQEDPQFWHGYCDEYPIILGEGKYLHLLIVKIIVNNLLRLKLT